VEDLLLVAILALVAVFVVNHFFGGRSRGGASGTERVPRGRSSGGSRGFHYHGGKGAGERNLREQREVRPGPPYQFYKSIGIGEENDVRVDFYPPDAYEEHLGGEPGELNAGGFIAATKAYRPIEDDWYEMPLDRAVEALELEPEDYEADAERGALLLRKLPTGFPASVRKRLL
jgi:hypothetical protein